MAAVTDETEIKLRIENLDDAKELIESCGFRVSVPQVFERNIVFDNELAELRNSRRLLRLRHAGTLNTLTYKGVATTGKHKAREERETVVGSFDEMLVILERLGFRQTFVYEKFRTEYTDGQGLVTIDETPIGNFLEVEGAPIWIDDTAKLLGFQEEDYMTASYGTLYAEWCARHKVIPANMTFTGPRSVPDRFPSGADPV